MSNLYPSIMAIIDRPDTVFVSGKGSWLKDEQGALWLDFIQGWAVNSLGHCHPAVVSALQKQAESLLNPSPAFYNKAMIGLAQQLTANSVFDEVFFTNSGAEANEGAIKLARKWGAIKRDGAYKIITFEHGFHGRTLATMAATGKPGWDVLFPPAVSGFIKVPYNDIGAVEAAVDNDSVAIMLELIQGEAGVIPATAEFLHELSRLARKHGLLLIVDEVQTGMGRTGTLFAYEQFGIEPDIMTLGKGIGGGVPLAALLTKKRFSCFEPGDQGGTFNGNPLVCAAGQAVIDTLLQPGFLDSVQRKSAYLSDRLGEISQAFQLGKVRGKGLLLALDTRQISAPNIAAKAFKQGLLLNAPRPNTLRFMPALTVSEHEIDQMIRWLCASIEGSQSIGRKMDA